MVESPLGRGSRLPHDALRVPMDVFAHEIAQNLAHSASLIVRLHGSLKGVFQIPVEFGPDNCFRHSPPPRSTWLCRSGADRPALRYAAPVCTGAGATAGPR